MFKSLYMFNVHVVWFENLELYFELFVLWNENKATYIQIHSTISRKLKIFFLIQLNWIKKWPLLRWHLNPWHSKNRTKYCLIFYVYNFHILIKIHWSDIFSYFLNCSSLSLHLARLFLLNASNLHPNQSLVCCNNFLFLLLFVQLKQKKKKN